MGYKENRLFTYDLVDTVPDWAPTFLDDQSIAFQLGISNQTLWSILRKSVYPAENATKSPSKANPYYKRIEIPKPNGKTRVVFDPSATLPKRDNMKSVLKALSALLFRDCPWPEHVDAYKSGKSITDSAQKHAGCKTAIMLDIKDYFPSITRAMIRKAFCEMMGMNWNAASLLASAVTLQKRLPQGSPIAPAVANLVGWHRFDVKIIERLGEGSGWTYSRFSDDIIMSHPEDVDNNEAVRALLSATMSIREAGFKIVRDKVRIAGHGERRIKSIRWLGLTINEKVNVSQEDYRKLRQLLYWCSIHGMKHEAERQGEDPDKFILQVRGRMNFVKQAVIQSRADKLQEKFDAAVAVDALNAASESYEEV